MDDAEETSCAREVKRKVEKYEGRLRTLYQSPLTTPAVMKPEAEPIIMGKPTATSDGEGGE